jgi:uncharacterized protein (UPF0303 family)
MMSLDEMIAIVEKQEAVLRFPSFNRLDAWRLGTGMVSYITDSKLPVSSRIQLFSGLVLFQYMAEGTTLDNVAWMDKKFNMVRRVEISSLLHTLRLCRKGQTLKDRGLDPDVYVWGGGGFPLAVEGAGVIGAVIVSGLPDMQDHDTIVQCLSKTLNREAPRLPADARY